MEYIIETAPHSHIVILGADVQDPMGPRRAFDDPSILGEFIMGHMGLEGISF